MAGPATDGEAFEDVVVVGRAGLAARLARGTVLRRGGGLSITQLQSEEYTGGKKGLGERGEQGETEGDSVRRRCAQAWCRLVLSLSLSLSFVNAYVKREGRSQGPSLGRECRNGVDLLRRGRVQKMIGGGGQT